jgi:hypothetical protein
MSIRFLEDGASRCATLVRIPRLNEKLGPQDTARHPVRLLVTDDLRRNRLTVFFRLLLALPHFLWLTLWGVFALVTAVINWFATVFAGCSPPRLHAFLSAYLRYSTHVTAYTFLIADPFPGFSDKDAYSVDLEIDPPKSQNRWTVVFRIVLAIPALLITQVLRNLSGLLATFSWFVALVLGRVPEGIRNFAAFALRYETQTYAYIGLLTSRYPSFNLDITA